MKSLNETILVVKREKLFPHGSWQGLRSNCFDTVISLINAEKEFQLRSSMELDPTYKQIIPYLVFTHKNHYFLMQRTPTASEVRLQNKFSLGIGGHIRKEDITENNIFEWARREFYEEINYDGSFDVSPLGIINDDSDDVGKVHLGIVLLVKGNSPDIKIKSELKSGSLLTLDACKKYKSELEGWSTFVVDALENETSKPVLSRKDNAIVSD